LAAVGFGDPLDRVAVVAEQSTGFHELDCFVKAVAGGFDYADIVWILGSRRADVVGFVKVRVEAAVVE
jgi:hypothetical protein